MSDRLSTGTFAVVQAVVFVGLGNPGKEYALTRHNLGFLVLQECARRLGLEFKSQAKFEAQLASTKIGDKTLHLLLPTTYMNLSGSAVRKFCSYYGYKPDQIVVVTDDVAIDFMTMRLKNYGSSGGHNGLKSIEVALGTQHWIRLRMGIGPKPQNRLLDAFVLERFSPGEIEKLEEFVSLGAEVLLKLVTEDWNRVVSLISQRPVEPKTQARSLDVATGLEERKNIVPNRSEKRAGDNA